MHGEERLSGRPTFVRHRDGARSALNGSGKALALASTLTGLLGIVSPVMAEEALELGEFLAPQAVTRGSEESLTLFVGRVPIVLGETESVTLHVRSNVTETDSPLRASVNVGALGEVAAVEPGLFRVEYALPEARFPQVAIIALWRESGPDSAITFFRVPLPGLARVPVQTRPGAGVTVTVADRPFGPFRAGSNGRVQARVVVPPGVAHATVSAAGTTRRFNLEAPPYSRMTMIAVPHTVTADGASPVRVHVYYDAPGRPAPAASLRLQASRGELGTLAHRFGPLYEAEFKARPGTEEGELLFEASVARDPASVGAATIMIGRQRAAALRIVSSAPRIIADGSAHVDLQISALDSLGLGVSGLQVDFEIHPAESVASKSLVAQDRGEYRLRIVPRRIDPPQGPVELRVDIVTDGVEASESLALNAWSPAEVRIEPNRLRLQADGRSTAVLTVRAFDSSGRPLDHLRPDARVSSGRITKVEAVESRGWLIRYEAPAWEYTVPPTGRVPPPVREEAIRVAIGGVEAASAASLTAGIVRPWVARGYVELSGGYATNQQYLAGPQATLHAGAYLVSRPRLLLGGGIWAGASDQRGDWEIFGEDTGRFRARLLAVPVMASATAVFPLGPWSLGVGGGAGLMVTSGTIGLVGGEDLPIDALVHSSGARLFIGRRLGSGRFTLGVSYVHALQERRTGQPDVTGQLGGPGASVGYRLER